MRVTLRVNGEVRDVEAAEHATLLSVLRDDFNLTGARFGCGLGICGACTVLIDSDAVASCTLEARDAAGKHIVTIEGLSADGLHPLQRAFVAEDAMQCGFCTPGMILGAAALLARNPKPGEDEIRDALDPHLCRCGVYLRAVKAVRRASR